VKWSIWTGAAWESWSRDSPAEGGIGGSETAAVSMARELAKRGHEVELFGQFREGREGLFDGVSYIHYKRVVDPGQIDCDVFISSRDVNATLLRPKARVMGVWVHDINLGADGNSRIDKYDTVMCLSEWSAKTMMAFYPQLQRKKIFVTRNGIDVERFHPALGAEGVARVKSLPPRFTYSSSPDRGLDRLMDFWPTVREIWPGCELHVYYGFDNWKKMATNAAQRSAVEWMGERVHRLRNDGVVYHGRVGQAELAESFMASMLWLYPTDFKETSCITAMEAQAAGAVPICTGLAALSETVKHGVLIKPYNKEKRFETDFFAALRRLASDDEERVRLAIAGREHALANLSWASVAAEWETFYTNKISEKEAKAGG
jgi:glycosyltransferase involved in cell wall biosynthesis